MHVLVGAALRQLRSVPTLAYGIAHRRPSATTVDTAVASSLEPSVVRRAIVTSLVSVVAAVTVPAVSTPLVTARGLISAFGTPARLLDTRPDAATVDGRFSGMGTPASGTTVVVDVAGRAGLPSSLNSVALNVTVDDATAPGFVTVYPCDSQRPSTSNVNYVAGQTIANAVISRVSNSGTVCLFTLAAADLIVDVSGYLPVGGFEPLRTAARLLDSRQGEATVDGLFSGIGPAAPGSTLALQIAGRAGLPAWVSSVALNVTVDGATAPGFVTVYACNTPQPKTSNLNYAAGQTIANLVISRVSLEGTVCIFTLAPTDLIVDVSGYLGDGLFWSLSGAPERLLDSRPGGATVDGLLSGIGPAASGTTVVLQVAGRAGLPVRLLSAVLNVTVDRATAPGFVTAYPCDDGRPNTSNLNFEAGQTIANAVMSAVSLEGTVCLFTLTATDFIVDVTGYQEDIATTRPPGGGPDSTPPFAWEPTVSPSSVDVADSPAIVGLTTRVTDTKSGTRSVDLVLSGETQSVSCSATLDGGTSQDGVWGCSVTIPQRAPPGVRTMSATMWDIANNFASQATSATVTVIG